MERDKRAVATQVVRDKRKDMIRQIRRIQPQAGKNLKDVEVPHSLFHLARDIVNDPEASLRFSKVAVYELLLGDLKRRARDPASPAALTLDNAGPVLEGWKLASTSLFRYALNLVLAPSRAEFKKMKVSKRLPRLFRRSISVSSSSCRRLSTCTTSPATCTTRRRRCWPWATDSRTRRGRRARTWCMMET